MPNQININDRTKEFKIRRFLFLLQFFYYLIIVKGENA